MEHFNLFDINNHNYSNHGINKTSLVQKSSKVIYCMFCPHLKMGYLVSLSATHPMLLVRLTKIVKPKQHHKNTQV